MKPSQSYEIEPLLTVGPNEGLPLNELVEGERGTTARDSYMSGDFWCKKHSSWNCMCAFPPGLTTSGGGMVRREDDSEETFYGCGRDSLVPSTELFETAMKNAEAIGYERGYERGYSDGLNRLKRADRRK